MKSAIILQHKYFSPFECRFEVAHAEYKCAASAPWKEQKKKKALGYDLWEFYTNAFAIY